MSGTKLGETTGGRVRCHACPGWFLLGFTKGRSFAVRGEPVAAHSLPFCAAFHALETTLDAVRFSEACRASKGSEEPPP